MSNLKSGFSKLKTQATNAFDNLEQKLEKLDSEVISPTQQSRPISTPVNPEDVEKINWEVPKHENSNESSKSIWVFSRVNCKNIAFEKPLQY